jgi:predicted XRE-type DNA-binding protein
MPKLKVERGSGNVFADLGMPDADEHKLKAGLVAKLSSIMDEQGLSQVAASKLTGISQPDLSRVLRGRFRDFSTDRLLKAITHLDSEVEITVRHHGRAVGAPIHLEAVVA